MGNTVSSSTVDPRHLRIWQNLASLQSNEARIQMLETLLSGGEYVAAAKRTGIYAFLLQWIAAYRRGEPMAWPGAAPPAPRSQTTPYPTHTAHSSHASHPSHTAYSQQSHPQSQHQHQYSQQAQAQAQAQSQYSQQSSYPPSSAIAHSQPRLASTAGAGAGATAAATHSSTLATVPPPKRALDTLHESYRILSIDDTKPLTHETLRLAYKKAAAKAHPDRGGSPEAFDAVTRAFIYLDEVINKLIPKTAKDGSDVRFTAPVTKESALKARDVHLTKYDAEEAAHRSQLATAGAGLAREEPPKVALNPKNLNLNVFNQLFEENRLPDPDQDGYGDWLKSSGEDRRIQNESQLRSKFNSEVFNRTFMDQGTARGGEASVGNAGLTQYKAPDAITHHGGTELGGGRPSHFISPLGAKTGYTDLKYAYGEGSTFSQEIAGVKEEKRNFDTMKRERESAPVPLSHDEQRMLEAIERQKAAAEEERRRRLAVHDVAAEDMYAKMQRRLMINQ